VGDAGGAYDRLPAIAALAPFPTVEHFDADIANLSKIRTHTAVQRSVEKRFGLSPIPEIWIGAIPKIPGYYNRLGIAVGDLKRDL
jgi:hypothetical protein